MKIRDILLMTVIVSIISTGMFVVLVKYMPKNERVYDTYTVISTETSDSQSIFGTSHTYYLIVKDKNGVKKTYEVSANEYFTAKETGFYTRESFKEY